MTVDDRIESLEVRSGAAVLHVECRGPVDGRPVVLVHGLQLYRQNLNPFRLPPAPEPGCVTSPTLLLVATDDRHVTAPLARASLPLCTNASVVELEAGHWVVRSHPDELATVIADHVERHGGARIPEADGATT